MGKNDLAITGFEEAIKLLQSGVGPRAIDRAISHGMRSSSCVAGALIAVSSRTQRILTGIGIPFSLRTTRVVTPMIRSALRSGQIIPDFCTDNVFRHHVLCSKTHGWNTLYSLPLFGVKSDLSLSLAFCGTEESPRSSEILQELGVFADIISDELDLINDIANQKAHSMRRLPSIGTISGSIATAPADIILLNEEHLVLGASDQLFKRFGSGAECSSLLDFPWHPKDAHDLVGFVASQFDDSQPAATEMRVSLTCGKAMRAWAVRQASDVGDVVSLHLMEARASSSDLSSYPLPQDSDVLSRFLRETLVKQVQIKKRGDVGYHTLLRWRKAIKDTQISALRAAKSNPSEGLLNMVGKDISTGAKAIFGADSFDKVTHVACGHSGPNCFASQLAKVVAQNLGKPYEAVFERLPVAGSSHPKTNARRPKAKLSVVPQGRYLLIDDVATSGHHIAEAASILRKAEASAAPLAWVST